MAAGLSDLPAVAAWRHVVAHEGFEVLFPCREGDDYVFEGHAAGIEDGVPWAFRYEIRADAGWATRGARVWSRSAAGEHELRLVGSGAGSWTLDGLAAPELDGLVDVDLEGSAFTNAFPVNRLQLAVGESSEAPAVYVRVPDLRVERLEQEYARLPDDGPRLRFEYASLAFDYRAVLVYDEHGLVVDYPGIAVRAA